MDIRHVAWTGGFLVYGPSMVPIARAFYREQLTDWRNYWGDLPNKDTCKIFKNRARCDAYATWKATRRTA